MKCPKCGSENCQIITSTHTEGKDFSASKGCCGWLLAGPVGVLCGFCTKGKQTYSDILQNTIFIFGTNSEYDIADTAFIWCSLKDSSTLKNMPMIIWAACIQMKYFGDISEGKSDFLNWVNNGLDDGDRFESPYFIAQYSETPYDNCTLLIVRK